MRMAVAMIVMVMMIVIMVIVMMVRMLVSVIVIMVRKMNIKFDAGDSGFFAARNVEVIAVDV